MSITKLPVNYIDGVIDGVRKYEMTENQDETVSFRDVSEFIREELLVGADEFNNVNNTINELIDLSEDNEDRLDSLESDIEDIETGNTKVAKASSADYATSVTSATSATTADHAESVSSVGYANRVTSATTADTANSADSADEVDTAGSADTAETVGSVNNEFVISRQTLNFQNRVCTLYDSRITANSIAVAYFTEETAEVAKNADISVSVENIRVNLTAKNNPTGSIVASIKIRVV